MEADDLNSQESCDRPSRVSKEALGKQLVYTTAAEPGKHMQSLGSDLMQHAYDVAKGLFCLSSACTPWANLNECLFEGQSESDFDKVRDNLPDPYSYKLRFYNEDFLLFIPKSIWTLYKTTKKTKGKLLRGAS
jgi:hypothetical protein